MVFMRNPIFHASAATNEWNVGVIIDGSGVISSIIGDSIGCSDIGSSGFGSSSIGSSVGNNSVMWAMVVSG